MSANTRPRHGLSYDEHVDLGEALVDMRERLRVIASLLVCSYPAALARPAFKAQEQIDKLRSDLDEIVFREYPKLSTRGNANIYYPVARKS